MSPSVSPALRELLDSLRVDDLRELSLASVGSTPPQSRRKDEIVSFLVEKVPADTLLEAAERLEALSAFRHSWLFSIGSTIGHRDTSDLDSWAESLYPELSRGELTLDEASDDLQPTLQVVDALERCLYVKFTQWIKAQRWERISLDQKVLITERIRHPVVVVLRADEGIAEVRFDGFSRGKVKQKGAVEPYEAIAIQASTLISQRIGEELQGINLMGSVAQLLDTRADEVSDVRRVVSVAKGGKLVVDAGEHPESSNVSGFLVDFLRAGGKQIVNEDYIVQALNAMTADSVLLYWKQLGVMTRLSFHGVAPELLFIWRSGTRALSTIDQVITALISQQRLSSPSSVSDVFAEIDKLPHSEIVRPVDLMAKLNASSSEALQALSSALSAGLLDMRFRVKTEKRLHDFDNAWRQSLAGLPLTVTDEDGRTVDLENPKNIEIGFIRSSGVK